MFVVNWVIYHKECKVIIQFCFHPSFKKIRKEKTQFHSNQMNWFCLIFYIECKQNEKKCFFLTKLMEPNTHKELNGLKKFCWNYVCVKIEYFVGNKRYGCRALWSWLFWVYFSYKFFFLCLINWLPKLIEASE